MDAKTDLSPTTIPGQPGWVGASSARSTVQRLTGMAVAPVWTGEGLGVEGPMRAIERRHADFFAHLSGPRGGAHAAGDGPDFVLRRTLHHAVRAPVRNPHAAGPAPRALAQVLGTSAQAIYAASEPAAAPAAPASAAAAAKMDVARASQLDVKPAKSPVLPPLMAPLPALPASHPPGASAAMEVPAPPMSGVAAQVLQPARHAAAGGPGAMLPIPAMLTASCVEPVVVHAMASLQAPTLASAKGAIKMSLPTRMLATFPARLPWPTRKGFAASLHGGTDLVHLPGPELPLHRVPHAPAGAERGTTTTSSDAGTAAPFVRHGHLSSLSMGQDAPSVLSTAPMALAPAAATLAREPLAAPVDAAVASPQMRASPVAAPITLLQPSAGASASRETQAAAGITATTVTTPVHEAVAASLASVVPTVAMLARRPLADAPFARVSRPVALSKPLEIGLLHRVPLLRAAAFPATPLIHEAVAVPLASVVPNVAMLARRPLADAPVARFSRSVALSKPLEVGLLHRVPLLHTAAFPATPLMQRIAPVAMSWPASRVPSQGPVGVLVDESPGEPPATGPAPAASFNERAAPAGEGGASHPGAPMPLQKNLAAQDMALAYTTTAQGSTMSALRSIRPGSPAAPTPVDVALRSALAAPAVASRKLAVATPAPQLFRQVGVIDAVSTPQSQGIAAGGLPAVDAGTMAQPMQQSAPPRVAPHEVIGGSAPQASVLRASAAGGAGDLPAAAAPVASARSGGIIPTMPLAPLARRWNASSAPAAANVTPVAAGHSQAVIRPAAGDPQWPASVQSLLQATAMPGGPATAHHPVPAADANGVPAGWSHPSAAAAARLALPGTAPFIDVDELVERAWRTLMERLSIEQERRGQARWT